MLFYLYSFHFHCVVVQIEEGIAMGVSEVNLDGIIGKIATSLAGLTAKNSKRYLFGALYAVIGCCSS